MAMDVRDHRLVPEHRKMSEDEVEELLERFDIEKENLPRIKENDSALKQKDFEIGDVFEITRESPTAGETTYYRRVVEK
jgi:DNA-directed RNA polymerase subunit H